MAVARRNNHRPRLLRADRGRRLGPGPARVRARRHLPARPPDRPEGAGPDPADPVHRPHGQGRPADGHAEHPAAGGDHPRQRPRQRQRGRLLPGDRPAQSDRRGRKLFARHVADLADGAALGARQGRIRPAAVRARAAQRRAAGNHRRVDRALGRKGDRGRDQGRRDPRADAAGDRPPGRGRARAPGQDHQLRGRVPGGAEAHRRGRHHQHQPGLAAAALPADAVGNRQQPATPPSSSRCRWTCSSPSSAAPITRPAAARRKRRRRRLLRCRPSSRRPSSPTTSPPRGPSTCQAIPRVRLASSGPSGARREGGRRAALFG